ncbi:hypothetical protein ACZ90_67450 [Streptomyces albus subsp. albus]|nr:hypothetical protein ACZ90_67450 [Streptomyces albus subsp. albus]
MASDRGISRVDKKWLLVVAALFLGQVAVYIWYQPHLSAAFDDCADSACRRRVTAATDASTYWQVGGGIAAFAGLLKAPGGRTTPWRITCVLATAVCVAASMLQLD